MVAGLIIVQHSQSAPLKNFDCVGYIVATMGAVAIFLLYLINKKIKQREAS
jgi:hypothetical protein